MTVHLCTSVLLLSENMRLHIMRSRSRCFVLLYYHRHVGAVDAARHRRHHCDVSQLLRLGQEDQEQRHSRSCYWRCGQRRSNRNHSYRCVNCAQNRIFDFDPVFLYVTKQQYAAGLWPRYACQPRPSRYQSYFDLFVLVVLLFGLGIFYCGFYFYF